MLKSFITYKKYIYYVLVLNLLYQLYITFIYDIFKINNKNDETVLFVLSFFGLYIILFIIQQVILSKMGLVYAALTIDIRGAKENRAWILGMIPYVGNFIIAHRIYQLLIELEQKVNSGEVKL